MRDHTEDLAPTERFSNRVEHYAKHRPGYPPGLLDLLAREVGFSPASVVAELGSGTGILTEMLLAHGNVVYAVEPNADMRAAADRGLGGKPNFHSIAAPAEATGLPRASVDGILVAQAFHWFDAPKAVREFKRIAKPNGFVALIWNARKTSGSDFMRDYERIITTYGSDFARSGKELVPYETLRDLFGHTLSRHVLANHQDMDWPALRGRLLSASYMPLAGQTGHETMLAELRASYDRNEEAGQVRMEYDTQVYLGRLA